MNLERERSVHELLTAALEVDAADRRRWLSERAGDESLRREVESRLAEVDDLGDFLERPAVLDHGALDDQTPPQIPGYEILGRLGGGAMGEVFRARQHRPVERLVALKRVHAHLPEEGRARFFAEQQALARSSHESIARIYDAGATEDGSPWFSMELVEGEPITRYCDRHRLSLEDRLRLMIEVGTAVEHAHRKQILHRDLKPSNVLVVHTESGPRPKVIDFGIAKLLDEGLPEVTVAGSVGTPAYMSPEALGTAGVRDVDTRTDVYSLGVLLFELVVSRRPFDADRPPLGELVRRVREEDPPTATEVLSRLGHEEALAAATERATDIAGLRRRLAGDLKWILARALAPEREHRYGSARELSDDLTRFLAEEPVVARPPTRVYRLSKFWLRHRTESAAAAVAVVGLLAGAISLAVGRQEARREAQAARTALAVSEATTEFLVDLFRGADPTSAEGDLSVGELLDRGASQIEEQLADQPLARGRLLHALADVYMERGDYQRAEPMLDEAVRLLRTGLAPGDPLRASVLRSVGVLHFHRADWPAAEAAFEQATREVEPATDPEGWALGRHNLGVAVYRQGRHDEAETHLRAAYEVRRRDLPADHAHVARSTNALGALLISRGEPRRALEFLEESLRHRERTLGADHPDIAKSLHNIGKVEYDLESFAAAAKHYERAVTIVEEALGSDHPDLALTLMNLSLTYQELDRPEAALEAADRAVSIARAARIAPGSMAARLEQRAAARIVVGDSEGAGADFLEASVMRDQLVADGSPRTRARIGLAHVAVLEGRLDEAETLARAVLDERERSEGRPSRLGYPKRILALVAAARGDAGSAEHWFRAGLDDFVQGRAVVRHWERELRREFARWLQSQGRLDEAERISNAEDRADAVSGSRASATGSSAASRR